MQVLDDASPGDPAEVQAEVESLRAHDLPDGRLHASEQGLHFHRLRVGQLWQVSHLPIRADERVASAIGIGVEHRVGNFAASDDMVGHVIARLADGGEDRAPIGIGLLWPEDVTDAPR